MSKNKSVQAYANKVSLTLKNWNGWKGLYDFSEVWRWLEDRTEVEAYILLTELNKCQTTES